MSLVCISLSRIGFIWGESVVGWVFMGRVCLELCHGDLRACCGVGLSCFGFVAEMEISGSRGKCFIGWVFLGLGLSLGRV